MHLDGLRPCKLGSIQDRTRTAVYYRREQLRLFETMIGIYSAAMNTFPEMRQAVVNLADDYFEIVVPGSKQARKEDEKNFVEKQSKALDNIAKLLAEHAGKRKEETKNGGKGQAGWDSRATEAGGSAHVGDIRARKTE